MKLSNMILTTILILGVIVIGLVIYGFFYKTSVWYAILPVEVIIFLFVTYVDARDYAYTKQPKSSPYSSTSLSSNYIKKEVPQVIIINRVKCDDDDGVVDSMWDCW
jgi:hypothetical protein